MTLIVCCMKSCHAWPSAPRDMDALPRSLWPEEVSCKVTVNHIMLAGAAHEVTSKGKVETQPFANVAGELEWLPSDHVNLQLAQGKV